MAGDCLTRFEKCKFPTPPCLASAQNVQDQRVTGPRLCRHGNPKTEHIWTCAEHILFQRLCPCNRTTDTVTGNRYDDEERCGRVKPPPRRLIGARCRPPYSGGRGMQLGKTRFAFRNGWCMRLRGNDSRSVLAHVQSWPSHSLVSAGLVLERNIRVRDSSIVLRSLLGGYG